MVVAVGDVDVSALVERDAGRFVGPGAGGGTAIAGIAGLARAGAGRDDTGPRIDTTDAVIKRIREVEIAVRIEADIERPAQDGVFGRPAIPGKAPLAGADCRRDNPGLTWHQRPLRLQIPILAPLSEPATADVSCPISLARATRCLPRVSRPSAHCRLPRSSPRCCSARPRRIPLKSRR